MKTSVPVATRPFTANRDESAMALAEICAIVGKCVHRLEFRLCTARPCIFLFLMNLRGSHAAL